MSAPSWADLEALFHEALARAPADRAALLTERCAGRPDLQAEVEALLRAHAGASGSWEMPSVAPQTRLKAGARVGPYELLAELGAGGMGEVYRARDRKLNRDVALKVLPDQFALDSDRLARFQREAQVLASLNHPNIGGIHGLEESDGVQALVLELVEGPTLADRIAHGPILVDEALPIAKQIADALEAAHERGIIHRDLKPANIKVRPDGTVKVLDFGLAKLAHPETLGDHADVTASPTITSPAKMTGVGVILGTAAYMSPEQARGKPVDRRTDIWAFGCVLYEMLTGRRAFDADDVSLTLVRVLEREVDFDALPSPTSASVRSLLRRCLDKDPKRRLRDIGEARLALEGAFETTVLQAAPPVRVPQWRRVAVASAVAVIAGAVLAGAVVWFALRPEPPRFNPLQDAQFSRLTDFAGAELDAAISPDGQFVAFIADRDGPFHVWLSQIGTGRYVNLTPGPDDQRAPAESVGFSSNGSEIWLGGGPDRRLRLLPFTGGAPRFFLGERAINVAWSPDGQRIVYHTRDDGDPIFVADRIGANARQIFVDRPGVHNHYLAWSSDSRWIYFASGVQATAEMDLYRIPTSGGAAERLTRHNADVSHITPLDERTILYIAQDRDRSGPWLWSFDAERKDTRRLSFGLEEYRSVAASADGRRIVASVANPTASLWSVPILDHPAGEDDVRPLSLPTVRALAPRFGGMSLFYLSSSGAGDGLWRFQGGQAMEIWKGAEGALFEPPAVSPDGNRAAVVLRKLGRLTLHLLTADGAQLQSFAESIDVRGAASWSPDGKWIVTGGSDAAGAGLFNIPLDGSAPIRLLTGQVLNPVWSPDGNVIVYAGLNISADAPLLAVRPDGTSVKLPTIRVLRGGERYRFLPDGRGLVYLQAVAQRQDFWLLDMATRKSRQLTRFTNAATMRSFDVTPDGKRIVFDRLRDNSDIVLIDLPR